MTPEQQRLVRESWERVAPIAPAAAALFYERLFTLDPSLRALFPKTDMSAQGSKLMDVLSVAVHSLATIEKVIPALRMLGRRHAVEYGVRDTDYDTVGSALLWTLQQGLGGFFTQDVEDAWATTYSVLAGEMRRAGAEVTPSSTPSPTFAGAPSAIVPA